MTNGGRESYPSYMRFLRPEDATGRPRFEQLIHEDAPRTNRRPWPLFALALVFVSGVIGTPAPALHGEGLVTLLGGGTLIALFLIEVFVDPQGNRAVTAYSLALGSASIALMAVQPAGTAVLGTYAAIAGAVIRLPRRYALAVVIPIVIVVNAMILIWGEQRLLAVLWTDVAYAFMFLVGHLVRLSEEHQQQASELLEEGERTRVARAEAAALAERGRIARDMHDVLAHSLSALSVELEGARLLALDRETDSDVIAAIGRAHRHATSGLTDARTAIEALRGDSVPGPERLADLVADFEAQGLAEVTLTVEGEPHPLSSEAALAIYRTAQEALTNVRKHAAEATAVGVRLSYREDGTELTVENHGAGEDEPRAAALATAGSGYGVSGMRERAELIGGRLLAGPTASGYRVELWVPA
jgi:signal transduction histidine kinase